MRFFRTPIESRFRLRACLLKTVAIAVLPYSLASPQDDTAATDKRIFEEIRGHNRLMENLQFLSDTIGPRVTGSDRLNQAVSWASDLARAYGLENVHAEGWKIAHSWKRGSARARIVSPIARDVIVASAGWSPGTAGDVRGKVIYVRAANIAELRAYSGKLAGAIVMLQPAADMTWQASPSVGSGGGSPIQTPEPPPDRSKKTPQQEFDSERGAFFRAQGVGVILQESDKAYGLLNTRNAGTDYEPAPVPVAIVTHEDYALLWRLQQKNPVEMEISLTNSFSEGPVEAYNTVAEIRGADKPDEVVILCAHLDSWDLGTGASDDGAAVVSVLEAARAIKALGLRPTRTIRLVLFAGEEQGEAGSQQYVREHRTELDKISAVLADDAGAGRVTSIRLNQNFAAHRLVDAALAPIRGLKLIEPGMERFYGSDYASFNDVGVPGFSSSRVQTDYFRTHHSQADTFDKVIEEDVIQGAQALAGWAWNTAQLPQLLPRDK